VGPTSWVDGFSRIDLFSCGTTIGWGCRVDGVHVTTFLSSDDMSAVDSESKVPNPPSLAHDVVGFL